MSSIYGTPFADILVGTHDGDVIWAYGGDDFLNGKQGDDFLYGGDGNDSIHGGSGNDVMYGGNGDDLMTGGSGDDVMYGGTGADYMSGGGGDDLVVGQMGDDWLQGGGGDDRILGGSGDDFLQGQSGADALSGGQGNDTLSGGTGADQFHWIEADFNNPKSASDLVADFSSAEGDKIYLNGFLPLSALLAALAAPGQEQVFATKAGANGANIVGVEITYGNDPRSMVNPDHHVKLYNDPNLLDTHIQFFYHDAALAPADIWVWDSQLQASDFVVTSNVIET